MTHTTRWETPGQWGEALSWRARSWPEQVEAVRALGGRDPMTVAREVLAGEWGDGFERIGQLTVAGYDWREVQALVDALAKD